MPELDARKRSRLPDSAFAYIDSKGRRRLPIHDESHVRNALARFEQTAFEDDAARERARERLLRAARKHGIVPIGFFDRQLRSQRREADAAATAAAQLAVENERLLGEIEARSSDVRNLPTGFVTFLLTDIEGSTGLLHRLGDGYAAVLADTRRILRTAVRRAGGHEIDARADEFFAAFDRPGAALEAALGIQRQLRGRAWPDGEDVRLRIGLHSGRPTLTDTGYVGLDVHTAARVCSAGHGGQIVLSASARAAVEAELADGVMFRDLGLYRLHGLPEPEALFQVDAADLATDFPPPRAVAAAIVESEAR